METIMQSVMAFPATFVAFLVIMNVWVGIGIENTVDN